MYLVRENEMEGLGWLATILAVTGALLVNRKMRAGFELWIIANALTAVYHGIGGQWSMVARDIVFFLTATEGLILWRRKAS